MLDIYMLGLCVLPVDLKIVFETSTVAASAQCSQQLHDYSSRILLPDLEQVRGVASLTGQHRLSLSMRLHTYICHAYCCCRCCCRCHQS
jgi:polysaccharide pyruvyl transferase WcaK-like protein